MESINTLLKSINANKISIHQDICANTSDHISKYISHADDYLVATDWNKNTWKDLNEENKQSLHLFIMMNEIYHYKPASKHLLINASLFFPIETNIHRRLALFSKLSKMNNIQDQYRQLMINLGTIRSSF